MFGQTVDIMGAVMFVGYLFDARYFLVDKAYDVDYW